ncbi:hypothetical protein [Bradyrhizobium sp. 23AC]
MLNPKTSLPPRFLRTSNKPISVRIAYSVQFRDDLLIRLRVMVSSVDLIEQAVGYPVHLPPMRAAQ